MENKTLFTKFNLKIKEKNTTFRLNNYFIVDIFKSINIDYFDKDLSEKEKYKFIKNYLVELISNQKSISYINLNHELNSIVYKNIIKDLKRKNS